METVLHWAEPAVAVGTLLLAIATFWLAKQAKAEVAQARASEIARRTEVHIVESDPLEGTLASWTDTYMDGQRLLKFRVKNVGDRPVFGITATLRSNDSDISSSPSVAALSPGEDHVFTYVLEPFARFVSTASAEQWDVRVNHLEVFVESKGLLAQRVLQRFRIRLDRMFGPATDAPICYLEHIEIVPNVDGGTSARTSIAG